MAYVVAAVSAWLVLSALTALRPGRRGLFATIASYPVGWAAGELAAQALVLEVALVGVLFWWGWPRTSWLGVLTGVLAGIVIVENFALVVIQFYSRRVVRRALADSPREPLDLPRPSQDLFGSWWRTALQIPFHPRDMQLITNIAYGPLARHRLDVWRMSTTPKDAPVIFYIHGGAWSFGDKREQGRPMLHEFVRRGWVAVACNYRLAPRNLWPAQIQDVTRTLAWIKKYVPAYGGDPSRIVVTGGSAGGHLAALLALSSEDPTWRPPDVKGVSDWSVRGAIPLYGVLEMTGDEAHWHGLGSGLRTLLEQHVVQKRRDDEPAMYEAMSPYHRLDEHAPPFLVVQGGNDTLVDVNVARNFVDQFRRVALARIYYVELPFTQHAFDVTASPRTSAVVRAAVVFAESVVRPVPALTSELLASYQVPPTELSVELSRARRAQALEVARELGPYWVVTADNPYSQYLDLKDNDRRRRELDDVLDAHEVTHRASVAHDPSGRFPDEQGFALFGTSEGFVRSVAKAFEQFAYYFVDDVRVRVELCDEKTDLLLGERHRH
jgi:acetyl esterase/lipase